MSGSVVGLHWYHKDPERFITWGSEIKVYKVITSVDKKRDSPTSNINIDLSNNTEAVLETSETRYQYIRCVAPSYQSNCLLAAAGLADGKVALCNFVPYTENNIEFTPRQSRPCLCVAWNETEKSLLAMGHDRNRSDHCITIWDTERGSPKETSILHLIGLSETAHSICWDRQSRILFSGMSHKYIKIMDLRQSNSVVSTANTRAVHGLCLAPNGKFLASYIDNIVGLWDIRNIEKPISQIQMQKNINCLAWCPLRTSVLATLQRDSPFVHLLDMHWAGYEMEGEPHPMKRYAAPFQSKFNTNSRNSIITDMAWHPFDMERLLALSGSGNIIDFKLPQRVAVAWDTSNNLWGSTGTKLNLLQFAQSPTSHRSTSPWESNNCQDDISILIHKRALIDYGQVTDIQRNGDLAQNVNLRTVWRLLGHMNRDDRSMGLKLKLGINITPEGLSICRSEILTMNWLDFPTCGVMKTYRCEQRDFAQFMCGWTFDRDGDASFYNFIEDLCNKQEYTRAAFISAVHLKIRFAIEMLGKGADVSEDPNSLRMAAIALSGFNLDKGAIWRSQCSAAHSQISDSYLRALFAFLTPENDNFESVLNETGVSLCDRMAFACIFLPDLKLAEYVRDMIQSCTEQGDLHGLLLTGATNEGINLLQSHLDWTEDVQTVSLIAVRFMPLELLKDYRVQYWISSYRDLLDTWGLWEQRAQLDITLGNVKSPPRSSKSVFLLCSFCGKSVSGGIQEDVRVRTGTTHVNKLSSCPYCRKPLPRCSLCLLHMGTTTGVTLQHQSGHGTSGWQSKPFSKWFSWCQTCRHGGHTEHLAQWFSQHTECPVTSCSCKCFAMDLPMPKFPREIS